MFFHYLIFVSKTIFIHVDDGENDDCYDCDDYGDEVEHGFDYDWDDYDEFTERKFRSRLTADEGANQTIIISLLFENS